MKKLPHGLKRKLVQICAFGFTNSRWENFASGKLYTGAWKQFCHPGLNCHSCPGATLACPIGALQAVNGSMDFSFSFYAVGILLAFGVLLGRAVCGWLCPFGLLQELIAKVPIKKHRLPRWTRYVKYGVLIWFVLIWPWLQKSTDLFGLGDPTFCEYICPAGMVMAGVPLLLTNSTLYSAVGPVFSIKVCVLGCVIVGCLLTVRFFCKVLCPLGAIYGLLNKVSLYRVQVDEHACTHCHACARCCPMDVDPVSCPDDMECIRCGQCAAVCKNKALKIGFGPWPGARRKPKRSSAKERP